MLLSDLIAFFENQESRIQMTPRGVTLREAMQHFRTVRHIRGDGTAAYLRRAFRRMPWTFGSVKAFDARSGREEMLGSEAN